MGRWVAIVMVGGLLSACGTFAPELPAHPAREVIGVSVSRPEAAAAPGPAVTTALAWKVSQLCTNGNRPPQQDLEPAEEGQQLVDWKLRCRPYQVTFFGRPIPNDLGF